MQVDITVAISASPVLLDSAEVTQQWASRCRDQVYPRTPRLPPPPPPLRKPRVVVWSSKLTPFLITIQRRSSRGSLARIPKPPAQPRLTAAAPSGVFPSGRPASQLDVALSCGGGGRKGGFFFFSKSIGQLFINITSNEHIGDPLSRRGCESAETRGLEWQTHPDTVKQTVSSSRRLN